MAKQNYDPILSKPLPDPRVPWFVILCLIAALVLVYLGFLRKPEELLGPKLPPNEYSTYMEQKPAQRPAPRPQPQPQPATPAHPPATAPAPNAPAAATD